MKIINQNIIFFFQHYNRAIFRILSQMFRKLSKLNTRKPFPLNIKIF